MRKIPPLHIFLVPCQSWTDSTFPFNINFVTLFLKYLHTKKNTFLILRRYYIVNSLQIRLQRFQPCQILFTANQHETPHWLTDLTTSFFSISGGFSMLLGDSHCPYISKRNWRQEWMSRPLREIDRSLFSILTNGNCCCGGVGGAFSVFSWSGLLTESGVSESAVCAWRAPTTDQIDSTDT